MDIKTVSIDNFHTVISKYVSDKCIKITDIDSMIDTYMAMVEDQFLFTFDRDLLKDMLVDLTYMYSPKDDANKSRVLYHLVGSDSDEESDDDDDMMSKITDLTEKLRNGGMNLGSNIDAIEEAVDEEQPTVNVD
jgi:hypothetical protein